MKRLISILGLCICFSYFILGTSMIERVYDFADILTSNEIETLENESNTFRQAYQMDMVIVTTNDTNGKISRDYADDFYDDNGFGYGSTKDGILLLLDMDNRQVYISTCGSAISIFNDARINTMLENCVYFMKQGTYGKAAYYFIQDCKKYLDAGSSTQSNTPITTSPNTENVTVASGEEKMPLIEALLIAFGIAGSVTLIIRFSVMHRYKKPKSYLPPMLPLNVHFRAKNDRFVTSYTTRVHAPKNNNNHSSGGGFGGGSSTHTSSSGSTHGGGGMGF